jgi:hypothetical protein
MTINLKTEICLFDGRLDTWRSIAVQSPVWTGTLASFWENNQDDLVWGDVRDICDVLDISMIAHVDKGAGGVHSICTAASRHAAAVMSTGASVAEHVAARAEENAAPSYMTFEAFQATKRECADLGAALADDGLKGQSGLLYDQFCYIENMPVGDDPRAVYYLLIERSDWIDSDLTALERRLYEWARAEHGA